MALDKRRRGKRKDIAEEQSSVSKKIAVASPQEKAFHVVGIGASAGGLEAIEQFFKNIPSDSGMAFVIVQHLDPACHSSMPEIMSRLTKMPISVATDGMKVEADSVYLIPPDKNMGIQDGALFLREATESRGLRLPVDFFLRSLERRMSVNGIDGISEYARFLRENEPEARALLKDLLISVTNFFQDPKAFDALKENLCALMKDRAQGDDLRVWVAGCATGEEAYSVAMAISECMDAQEKRFQVQMYATDIDTDALKIAGIYPANIAADLTPARLKRFFLKQEKSYQVKKEISEIVVFAPQNFIKDQPFSRMDLICCRNLLIYLESDVQKRLLPLLHYALKPGGLLFLGPSETVGDATDLFSTLDKKWKIFQRKEVAVSPERLRFPSAFAPSLGELTSAIYEATKEKEGCFPGRGAGEIQRRLPVDKPHRGAA